MDFLKRHSFFIGVLFTAAILRFYGIWEVPMDSDELGALFRAHNTQGSFLKHLTEGVAIDGHPAGVQTVLWFLIKIFGFDEWKYKLLWGVFSLLNLVLFYRFAKQINQQTADYSTLFLAFLYLPMSMSVWVRPYELGLTALLLFLNFRKESNSWFVGFLLSLTLYTHYFSFLAAFIYWIIDQEFRIRRHTIIVASVALLLIIPQWSVLAHQIGEGGLSWLGRPQPKWFIDHVHYLFNQSNLLLLSILICTAFSIYHKERIDSTATKLIISWALVLLIGWSYSYWFKPVLQDHVVYFALPFFLTFVSNFSLSWVPSWGRYVVLVILIVSLVEETNFQKRRTENKFSSPFQLISRDKTLTKFPVFAEGPEDILNYQSKKFHLNFDELASLEKQTVQKNIDTFIFISNSGSPVWMLPWLESKFQRVNIFGSQLHSGMSSSWFTAGGRVDAFVNREPSLNPSINLPNDSNVFIDFKNIKLNLQQNDWIYFEIEPQNSDTFEFITALFEPGFNKALNQIDYRYTVVPGPVNPAIHALKLEDIPNKSANSVLRMNIHSKTNTRAHVELNVMKGNPWQYGFPHKQILTF